MPEEESRRIEIETAEETVIEAEPVYCTQCGAQMREGERFCGSCGWDSQRPEQPPAAPAPPAPPPRPTGPASDYNRMTVLLLCLFLGVLGVHRFYVGKVGTGILWLLSLGVIWVGWIYDLVLISTGEFTDRDGRRIVHWQ